MSLISFCPSLCRRAHTVTVLFILTCALVYVTLLEETPQNTAYNTKRSVGFARHSLSVLKAKKLQDRAGSWENSTWSTGPKFEIFILAAVYLERKLVLWVNSIGNKFKVCSNSSFWMLSHAGFRFWFGSLPLTITHWPQLRLGLSASPMTCFVNQSFVGHVTSTFDASVT